MRIRRIAWCLLIGLGLSLAGCDRCLECRCTCDRHTQAVETLLVQSRPGFDCGQMCEREENCGLGDVIASECVRTTRVDAGAKDERCASADLARSEP